MIETEEIALTGGSWRPRGGIVRWVQDDPAEDVPQPVACRRCGARADQGCRTRTGERTKAHVERHIPRRCSCGANLGPKRRLCDDCNLEAGRRQSADWSRRRREMAA